MDGLSAFFFNLERSVAQRKQMTCLKLPRGRVTTSLVEMRSHAMDLYVDLFEAEQCSMEFREELLERLPQVSPEEKDALGCGEPVLKALLQSRVLEARLAAL
eukprot:superscaffoldBa00002362_g14025